jgi:serine protease Do
MLPWEFRRRFDDRRRAPKEKEDSEEDSVHREPIFDASGSGIVLDEEGFILTNRHVVDGADKITVRFAESRDEFEAEVRGVDAQSDLAVIKVKAAGRKLMPARFADSTKTRVGEFAIAIGAPFELDYSVTFGHVSAKGRSHIIEDPSMDQDFLQTDANINPGNSGGPLVNIDGEIIGVNTLIRGMRSGIGFAIPSNLAKEVAMKLVADGKYVRAWLGIAIGALRDEADFRESITGISEGVLVKQIQPGGPAAKSDLKPSDVITAVDSKAVTTAQELKNEIRTKTIGAPVTLDVYRFGKQIKIKVKPEAWPEEITSVASREKPAVEDNAKGFGLTVKTLTKELAKEYGVERMEGVVVTEVERGSVAERKGIRNGDVITEVDQQPVTTPKQFLEAIKSGDRRRGVVFIFTSRGTIKTEILKDTGE